MGFWQPQNIKSGRGDYYSWIATHTVPATTHFGHHFEFSGILWMVAIKVHAAVDSHKCTFCLSTDRYGYIHPCGITFENLDLYGSWDSSFCRLTNYNVDGICSFIFVFPTGIRIKKEVDIDFYNASAVPNIRNIQPWYEIVGDV